MKNYAIKNLNGWQNVEGKIFLGKELGMTGAEASLQRIAAGEDAPFLHSHKTHEELYVIISGKGEYEVDGEKTAVSEGTIIRVSPAGVRALRNTSNKDMVMMPSNMGSSSILTVVRMLRLSSTINIVPCFLIMVQSYEIS